MDYTFPQSGFNPHLPSAMDLRPSTQKNVLITGGTGHIGARLTELLLARGYKVSHLSRRQVSTPGVNTFHWDVIKGEIDTQCIDGVDVIIHLAGEGIADKRWTAQRKKAIIDSRTESIRLIYKLLRNGRHQVKTVISASAIGYYGDRGNQIIDENSLPADDFLANCCMAWEAAVDEGKQMGLRVVKFRTGVVLDKEGALQKMARPIKWDLGSPLGSGRQWVSWIHVQDLIDMYLFAIGNEAIQGVYNAVTPNPVTNKQLTKAIAKQLRRPLWLPNIPAFVLKLLLGEMSAIVLCSDKVSSQKIEHAGFKFKYPFIAGALKEIYYY
jgi:uncharacterized protein (TIGR01777 family)